MLTVGDVQAALAGVPADMPLRFVTAEEPGSEIAGPEQIAYELGLGHSRDPETGVTFEAFIVDLEFPPGRYERTVYSDENEDP